MVPAHQFRPAWRSRQQQLTDAVNELLTMTSANTNAVHPLDLNAYLQTAIGKLNELISAMRR